MKIDECAITTSVVADESQNTMMLRTIKKMKIHQKSEREGEKSLDAFDWLSLKKYACKFIWEYCNFYATYM